MLQVIVQVTGCEWMTVHMLWKYIWKGCWIKSLRGLSFMKNVNSHEWNMILGHMAELSSSSVIYKWQKSLVICCWSMVFCQHLSLIARSASHGYNGQWSSGLDLVCWCWYVNICGREIGPFCVIIWSRQLLVIARSQEAKGDKVIKRWGSREVEI